VVAYRLQIFNWRYTIYKPSKKIDMPTTTKKKAAPKKSKATNGHSKATNGQSKSSNGQTNSQLEKFFHDQLKDIYWAEKHLLKALPKMRKGATTEELKSAFELHTKQTAEHVSRLEQVFELMGKKVQAKKCDGMEGLSKEGEAVLEETEVGSMTRDAGIIMAAQKVEHYEIATYGTLIQLAKVMGNDKVASILETTLEEEKQTDQNLTALAENNINWEAEQEVEEEE
jgi:ferritin-like metal-binding protein YciE